MKQEIVDRYRDNIARVRNLGAIYERLGAPGQGRRPVNSADVLRAATVLLHSALEDYIRAIARWRWPDAPKETIDEIPLLGISASGRPEKFLLGALLPHRRKKVSRVIRDSVNAYLDKFTVNDTADLSKVLKTFGVNIQSVTHTFARLTELMKRRHHIVHQADRNPNQGRGQHRAQSLGTRQVNAWIDIVEDLVSIVNQEVPDQ